MLTIPNIFKINFRFSHPAIRFKKTADFIWQLAQNILLLHPLLSRNSSVGRATHS